MNFSETERAALEFLMSEGGSALVTKIPDKTETDLVFRTKIAGMTVYKKLEKKGLCYVTETEPEEDGFQWTESVEITDLGKETANNLRKS